MKKHKDDFDLMISSVMKQNLSRVNASDELIRQTLQRIREEGSGQSGKAVVTPVKSEKTMADKKANRARRISLISMAAAVVLALIGSGIIFMTNRKDTKGRPSPANTVINEQGKSSTEVEVINTEIPEHYENRNETPARLTVNALGSRARKISDFTELFNLSDSHFANFNNYYTILSDTYGEIVMNDEGHDIIADGSYGDLKNELSDTKSKEH